MKKKKATHLSDSDIALMQIFRETYGTKTLSLEAQKLMQTALRPVVGKMFAKEQKTGWPL